MKPKGTRLSDIGAIILTGVMVIIGATASAQQVAYNDEAELVFQHGVWSFDHGRYADARKAFDSVLAMEPEHQRTTAALVMKAKSLYAMNEYYDASKAARSFLTRYPSSRYAADAGLLLARIYLHIERYDEARDAALQAWHHMPENPSASLVREILAAVDTVFLNHTSLEGVYNAIAWDGVATERAHLWQLAVRREIARGNLVAAGVAVDTLASRYSALVPHEVIDNLRVQLNGMATMKIGVVLPLLQNEPSSPMKEVGNAVYDGVLAAFQRFTGAEGRNLQISLDTRDSKHDVQTVTDEVRALVRDSSVIAVIGPVYSNVAIAAARVAGANRVPLVTPTANQNGISELGPSVFQVNPDYEQRGRAMARYAVQVLGCRVVAVLAPSDTYAKFLADGFAKEAKEEGATVIAVAWYQKGMSDLRSQFATLRAAGLQETAEPLVAFGGKMGPQDVMKMVLLGVPVKRVDSLLAKGAKVPARWLLGPRGKELLDSVGVQLSFDVTGVDSIEKSVTGIQALYCPISGPEEIGVVSSQLVYNNIKTHLLGSGEWNSLPDLDASRRYCTGIQFETDTFVDSSSTAFRQFFADFSAQFKRPPEKFTLYGYDAANLVFSLIAGGATSRESLTTALAATTRFPGLRGRIGFSRGRVNAWVHVVEYNGEGIVPVTEINGASESGDLPH
jgi:ABC-type branched-subunit amino acid transport system substrate-binding protein